MRAIYEQSTIYGVDERIEIHQEGHSGTPIVFEGRSPLAFDFSHRDITSDQRQQLSIFENQIIEGALDLYLRVDSQDKRDLIDEIADAPQKEFYVEWYQDNEKVWTGYPYGRIVEFPERPQYNVHLQFRDFEILKALEYPLDDTRQRIIETITDILSDISGDSITSASSWQEQFAGGTDILGNVYHDTTGLRDYASGGFREDQNITYFEALLRCLDPMMIIHQWKGFQIRQISAFNDPTDVQVTEFINSSVDGFGFLDLTQPLSTSSDTLPSAKVTTLNRSYPALRRASYEYLHRSGSSQIEFPTTDEFQNPVDFGDNRTVSASLQFAGSGDEQIQFNGIYETNNENNFGLKAIRAGDRALDEDRSWQRPNDHSGFGTQPNAVDTGNGNFLVGVDATAFNEEDPVMLQGDLPEGFEEDQTYYVSFTDAQNIRLSSSPGGADIVPETEGGTFTINIIYNSKAVELNFGIFRATYSFRTDEIPAMDGSIEVSLIINDDTDRWFNVFVSVINPTEAGESIEYRLTQEDDYPDSLRLPDSYFGDGPFEYSKASFRYSENTADITSGWRRRGETEYIPYSQLKLREVLDYQRVRQKKTEFEIHGQFDPNLIYVYKGINYMYIGGRYNSRWSPIMVEVEENLA